jgi:hypothetical protein
MMQMGRDQLRDRADPELVVWRDRTAGLGVGDADDSRPAQLTVDPEGS